MEPITRFVGIDPGIVHTGVVYFAIDPNSKDVTVVSKLFVGCPADDIDRYLLATPRYPVFVEAFRSRSNLQYDQDMIAAVAELKKLGYTVLDNTGVKKVVTSSLMKLLGCWDFKTPTHHQDLRSAARIGLLGALKDLGMNELIAQIVIDNLSGNSWRITQVP